VKEALKITFNQMQKRDFLISPVYIFEHSLHNKVIGKSVT